MRNLKKVLSLVLCVAMLLSVMVMGTGAAFTDQDEIQNAEAVDMTSALGIIDGYEDGSFQPAENIERGEAAKMISAMLNGGRDSVQETTESSYNDVLGSGPMPGPTSTSSTAPPGHRLRCGRRPLRSPPATSPAPSWLRCCWCPWVMIP